MDWLMIIIMIEIMSVIAKSDQIEGSLWMNVLLRFNLKNC